MILGYSGAGIVMGFMLICLLVILYRMFRRRLYAGIALFVVLAALEVLAFTHSLADLAFGLITPLIWTLFISRFGLVANVTERIVFVLMLGTLFTLNFSAWYASGMFLTLFVIFALLAYGFKVSLANRPLFGNRLTNE
jgi:hypothetical protein